MIIVGHVLGKVGLSAVSIGGDVANFLMFFAMGFASAGQVIIAQLLGAGKSRDLGRLYRKHDDVSIYLSDNRTLLR